MSANLTIRFPSVLHLWQAMQRTRKGDWRIVEPHLGMFHALPSFRGVALATDGSVLIAQREDGTFIEGHITNWHNERSECTAHSTAKAAAKVDYSMPARISQHLAMLLE